MKRPRGSGRISPAQCNGTGGALALVKSAALLTVVNFTGQMRLITPVYPNETIDDADKRLGVFAREIVSVLDEFLPK